MHAELLASTPYTAQDEELAETAKAFAAAHDDPVDAVLAALRWVHESLTYQPGVTGVHTSAAQAWQARLGVCQDFAHVALVVVRAMGVPARYVSGYLHPQRDAAIGERVEGESHAWIEAWTGEWWGFDPTNNQEIGHRHVGVAPRTRLRRRRAAARSALRRRQGRPRRRGQPDAVALIDPAVSRSSISSSSRVGGLVGVSVRIAKITSSKVARTNAVETSKARSAPAT